ncbi:MAG: monovalent cation/H+ antiporter complex subunit F [Microthrixaceae bacterium]
MTTLIIVCQVIVAIAALLCVVRLVLGPSLADRAVAVDTLLVTIGIEIVLSAARIDVERNLVFFLVAGLVAFIGTTSVGRFIERRGSR